MKKMVLASALILGTLVSTGVFAAQTNQNVTTTTRQTNGMFLGKVNGTGYGEHFGMGRGKGFGIENMLNSGDIQKIKTTIANKDYTTWSKIMNGKGIAQVVNTEAKFGKLVQIENLKNQINTLSEEIGLTGGMMGIGNGKGRGMGGHGKGMGMGGKDPMINNSNRDEIQTALTNKDYTTWSKLMNGKGIAQVINTQEKFNTFIKMHTAIQNGDTTTADKLANELGLSAKGQGNRNR